MDIFTIAWDHELFLDSQKALRAIVFYLIHRVLNRRIVRIPDLFAILSTNSFFILKTIIKYKFIL